MKSGRDTSNGSSGGALREYHAIDFDVTRMNSQAALQQILDFTVGTSTAMALTHDLLGRFDTLSNVFAASDQELLDFKGMTPESVKLLRLVAWTKDHANDPVPSPKDNGTRSPKGASHHKTPPTPATQSEMPLDVPGQTDLPLAETPPRRERRNIQDVLIPEGLMALKLAKEVRSLDELEKLLLKQLGQNSVQTRQRYAWSIIRWFFPDGLESLLPRVWQAYQDDAICIDLLRWSYLNKEPLMGGCIAEALFPCQNGLAIPPTYFDKYLQDQLSEAPPEKTRERLKINLKRIGFLERARSKPDRLLSVVSQKTSLLLLLHHLFAAKAVRTVELRYLFANPFWKYLGYKSEDAVRAIFREADAAGLFGKYIVADQLEQITTCFTLDELLDRKARL